MKSLFLSGVIVLAALSQAAAQQAQPAVPTPTPDAASIAATKQAMTAQRDTFVAAARAAGMTCTAAPPVIRVEPIPSWGNFDEDSNTLTTPDWSQLTADDIAFFARLAGPNADAAAVRAGFEGASHRWIFMHEMGHWVQYCQGIRIKSTSPWKLESGANRIAWTYWLQVDPAVPQHMFEKTDEVLAHMPNPVPPGQDMVAYFNSHYGLELAKSGAYPWFQSKMIAVMREEKPQPTFAQAIKNPAM